MLLAVLLAVNGLTGMLVVVFCSGCLYLAIADNIRNAASKDPAHRKLFVHGLAWETASQTLREVSA